MFVSRACKLTFSVVCMFLGRYCNLNSFIINIINIISSSLAQICNSIIIICCNINPHVGDIASQINFGSECQMFPQLDKVWEVEMEWEHWE